MQYVQTATGPGGKKMGFDGTQWVPIPANGAPAPTAAPAGPMMGPPPLPAKPEGPQKPEIRIIDDKPYVVDPTTATATPVTGADGANDPDAAVKAAIRGMDLDRLLSNVDNAERNMQSGWATGIKGAVAGFIPGSDRNDLLGNIDSIEGALVMEKLAALKAASATGASGMGALSEREGQRLAAAVASLRPDMSEDELRRSLATIRDHATNLKLIAEGSYGTQTPEGVAQAAAAAQKTAGELAAATGIAPVDPTGGSPDRPGEMIDIGGRVQFKDQEGMQGDRMTAEQEAAWYDFLKTNPSPEQMQAWFRENTQFQGGLANAEDIARANREGKVNKKFDYSRIDDQYIRDVLGRADKVEARGGGAGLTDLAEQGGTLGFSDEAAGVGSAITGAFRGRNSIDEYYLGRDTQRVLLDRARENEGALGKVAEIAGGVASLNPSTMAAAPAMTVRQAARQGGGIGALGGFGYGEGVTGNVTGTLTGGVLGSTLGGATQGVVNRVMGRVQGPPAPRPEALAARDIARAAEAEGVPLRASMVDPSVRAKAGALEASEPAGNIVREGMQETNSAIERGVNRLGEGGSVLNTDAAGNIVQRAARRFITSSRGTAKSLYDRARRLAGDAAVTPRESLAQLRRELTDLGQTPNTNRGEIDFINEIGGDLTSGPLTVDAIRNLRASVRGRIVEKNLTATQAEARAMRIIDAIQQDVTASLPPAAASAFRRADTYYRERMIHIDDVLDRFLGGNVERGVARLSGEKAFARLKAMASPGGDGRRLAAMMRNLDETERRDIAATIAQSLGRAGPDEAFSAARFVSMAKDLSPSARRTIFGPDGAQSIENLVILSRALRDSGSKFNRSESGAVAPKNASPFLKTLGALMLGGGGYGANGLTGAVGAAAVGATAVGGVSAAKKLSARALMSPRLTRWAVEAMQIPSARMPAHLDKLNRIAQREPALANDIGLIQAQIGKSAASDGEGGNDE